MKDSRKDRDKMKTCCKSFFYYHGLQGERNEPMQYCPYCGKQLTDKEFVHYNKSSEIKGGEN